jgi:hypothetical protein
MKRCTRCRQRLPLSSFHTDPTGRGDARHHCIECERLDGRERYGAPVVKQLYADIRSAGDYSKVPRRTAAAWRRQDRLRAMTDEQLAAEIAKPRRAVPRDVLAEVQRRRSKS